MIHDDQRDGGQGADGTFIRRQVANMPQTYFKKGPYLTFFC